MMLSSKKPQILLVASASTLEHVRTTLQSGVAVFLQKQIRDWNLKSVSQLDLAMISLSTNQSTSGTVYNFSIHFDRCHEGYVIQTFLRIVCTCSSFACFLYQGIPPKMPGKDIYYSTRYADDTGEFEYR